jgi:hypothetical protein
LITNKSYASAKNPTPLIKTLEKSILFFHCCCWCVVVSNFRDSSVSNIFFLVFICGVPESDNKRNRYSLSLENNCLKKYWCGRQSRLDRLVQEYKRNIIHP